MGRENHSFPSWKVSGYTLGICYWFPYSGWLFQAGCFTKWCCFGLTTKLTGAINELVTLLKKYKSNAEEVKRNNYKYVLSNNHLEEVLVIGK